jgi:hypothetical protein
MRIRWRQRRLGLGSLAVLLVLALRARGVPLLLPGCPWRAFTGVPCPTCFLTRSALATLKGDLGEALELHLFGPPLVTCLAWLGWWQAVWGRPLRFGPAARRLAWLLGMALLLYWALRLLRWELAGQPWPA